MSRYDWEAGRLKFSVKEWPRFKRAFREGWNRIQDARLAAANRHWLKFKDGLPDVDDEKNDFGFLWASRLVKTSPGMSVRKPRKRPRKPIRKDLPLATRSQREFCFGEARIELCNKVREASYSSGNNNHQVQRARKTEVGKLFFSLLARIDWTRGTGGTLVGNDEYNQEGREEGRGGNYATDHYPRNEPVLRLPQVVGPYLR